MDKPLPDHEVVFTSEGSRRSFYADSYAAAQELIEDRADITLKGTRVTVNRISRTLLTDEVQV